MDKYNKRKLQKNSISKGESLCLSKRRLTQIPHDVYELEHLRELDISHDCIVDSLSVTLDEEYWWEVSHDNNTIRIIGPGISKLKNLKEFRAAQVGLEAFPLGLCELQNLKYLDLRNNNISHLPEQIGQLKMLQVLDLSYNALSELPPEIGQLTSLKILLLNSNDLKRIPPEVGLITNLEELDLGNYNHYRVDPATVERFNLKLNAITEIPATICNLKKLKVLDMLSNALTVLPGEIAGLENLEWLEVGNHDIEDTPSGVHIPPFNHIEEIPDGAYDLKKLNRGCLCDIDPLCWYNLYYSCF